MSGTAPVAAALSVGLEWAFRIILAARPAELLVDVLPGTRDHPTTPGICLPVAVGLCLLDAGGPTAARGDTPPAARGEPAPAFLGDAGLAPPSAFMPGLSTNSILLRGLAVPSDEEDADDDADAGGPATDPRFPKM
jgi:hypothetical protein